MSVQPAQQTPAVKKNKKAEKPKKTVQQEIISWILSFVGAFAVILAMETWVGLPIPVKGGSMQNTLRDGELLWVSRLDQNYSRGDVVICHYPNRIKSVFHLGPGLKLEFPEVFVKRLVGLPGDTLEIRMQKLYVNGELVPDPPEMGSPPADYGPITLEEDQYFVIGDNRLTSNDSRKDYVGPISRDMLQGKVKCVLWPLNRIRGIQ
ncbi:MAG: signal peptidase I [Clostridia bacterium]|nr:signal peptidase I [Clostridia bacterium]